MRYIVFFLLAVFSFLGNAQVDNDDEVWTEVDQTPTFDGGMAAFYRYIGENLEYPKQARRLNQEGRVYVQFILSSTGEVMSDSTKVIMSECEFCESEAIRLVNNSPKWNPGRVTKLDKNVPVKMVLPIIFKRRN